MLEAAAAAETRGWEMSQADDETMTGELADNGVTVGEPSEAIQARLREIGDAMLADWKERAGERGATILQNYPQLSGSVRPRLLLPAVRPRWLRLMRRLLDGIYAISEWLAAACVVAIFLVILAQVGLNLGDKIAEFVVGRPLGLLIPSYAEFAAYLLAAASFLALASALNRGVHVRVSLVLNNVPAPVRRVLESAAALIGLVAAAYYTYWTAVMTYESWRYNDLSYGLVSIPMWIPQTPMVVGLALLSVAFTDYAAASVRGESRHRCPTRSRAASRPWISSSARSSSSPSSACSPWACGSASRFSSPRRCRPRCSRRSPLGQLLASTTWSAVASYPLTALPLFIWMGEILARSRLSAGPVRGPGAVDARSGRASPREHPGLRRVRCRVRQLGGNLRDRRAHFDPGASRAGLRRPPGARHARRLGDAGALDPAPPSS